jgi:hypothetical protein
MITKENLEFANMVLKNLYPKYEFYLDSFDADNDALMCDKLPVNIWTDYETGKYIVQGAQVVPGCHTMPNGDPGYPGDADVTDISQHDNFRDALFALFTVNAKFDIENAFDNAGEEMFYRDYEPPNEADFRDLG